MSIAKQPYEISVWDEKLLDNGTKEELKRTIIGAHDMDYQGRAIHVKLVSKINGTHELTFDMYDSFFDSAIGEYVHNDLVDKLCNEKKIKLLYKGEWLEFYIKGITENKNHNGLSLSYKCSDAFIEELSRNGYGITFDTEIYNNVEEIGNFTETILEDSIWHYKSEYNWGDFTEYSEEKLFKIPVSYFDKISGYKITYKCGDTKIKNIYTNEERSMEMGDDKAREEKYFWDNGEYDNGFSLVENFKSNIENDGYIYVPYSCLNFCYVDSGKSPLVATQEPAVFNNSYALSPSTIDPNAFIQFLAFPQDKKLEIDENGLILNKDCHYLMTVEQWNNNVNTKFIYMFEGVKYKSIQEFSDDSQFISGNKIVAYDGYFEKKFEHEGYNDGSLSTEIRFGKKISVTDRTECNISEDIDQYVKVYNNNSTEYNGCFTNSKWLGTTDNYRVCSKIETRNIIPQLARNYVQNGINITSTNGWEVMKIYDGDDIRSFSSKLEVVIEKEEDGLTVKESYLKYTPMIINEEDKGDYNDNNYYTVINFGIIGQNLPISSEKIYCLGWSLELDTECHILIGEGTSISSGEYAFKDLDKVVEFPVRCSKGFFLIKFKNNIENPYICIRSKETIKIKEFHLFEAYTKGVDFFKNGVFKYSGRELFSSYLKTEKEKYFCSDMYTYEKISNLVLFETDVMEGDSYEYTRYFIQQLKKKDGSGAYDTFMAKKYLDEDGHETYLPLDAGNYTEEDYEIVTNYIDLNNCSYYKSGALADEFDCSFGKNKICLYQKYGYCPYRFKTQKHCRKIRTLSGSKSNRFNLTQELSKIFEVYPIYYTEHYNNGKVKYTDNVMNKYMFYITEKGKENKLGFRYENNLKSITREKNSDEIITKLYVNDVDSSLSKTGMCSIKTAEDNPSKDSFIIDFSYYNKMGLLDEKDSNADLYGINSNDKGYLKTLGYYNENYDRINNKIINLRNSSLQELEANLFVNLEGIETAQKELIKIKKQMDRFMALNKEKFDKKKEG